MEEDAFAAWGTVSFGSDVPVDAYRKLYQDLKGRKLDPPDVQLVPGGIDGEDSGYDNADVPNDRHRGGAGPGGAG